MPHRRKYLKVSENLYRRLESLKMKGFSIDEIIEKGIEAIERKDRIKYRLCGLQERFTYKWPSGTVEKFEKVECYDVQVYGEWYRFYVAYGYRWAFGKNRRRVIVFLEKGVRGVSLYPLVEFSGTDSYDTTREICAFIRRPDKKYMKLDNILMYPEYAQLRHYIKDHSNVILGGRKTLAALTVREDDIANIIYHAVIQGRWRRKL